MRRKLKVTVVTSRRTAAGYRTEPAPEPSDKPTSEASDLSPDAASAIESFLASTTDRAPDAGLAQILGKCLDRLGRFKRY